MGLLKEGFCHLISEPDVDEMVRNAARLLTRETAATLEDVSVPMHYDGIIIMVIVIIIIAEMLMAKAKYYLGELRSRKSFLKDISSHVRKPK